MLFSNKKNNFVYHVEKYQIEPNYDQVSDGFQLNKVNDLYQHDHY